MRLGYGLLMLYFKGIRSPFVLPRLMFECAFGMYLFVVSDGRSVFFNTGHWIHLELLDFLALGILVPWVLDRAKDTFR